MRGLRAFCSSAVLVASLAACGAAPPGASPAGGDGVSTTLSVATPGSGGGTGSATSSAHPTSSTTTTPVIKVTDEVFAGLTEAEAERIAAKCHGSLSVPGTDDICVMPSRPPPCTTQHWCVRIATVPGTDLRAVQVQDRSPDKHLCGSAQELCPLLVVTRQVTSDVRITAPKTAQTTTPTGGATVKPKPTATPSPTGPSATKTSKPTATFKPSAGPGPTPPPAATVSP